MSQLIRYIIEMPEETDTEQRRYKYPYVASEVLSCDVPAFRDVFFDLARSLIEQLLSVLQQPPPLPPVLAGYCSKVVVSLYKTSPDNFLLYFSQLWAENDDSPLSLATLLPRLLLHVGSDAVLNMLVVLCVGEASVMEAGMPQMPAASSWLPHSSLVPALFDSLASDDAEAAQNSSVLICSVLDVTAGMLDCLSEGAEDVSKRCYALVRACLGQSELAGALNLAALEVFIRLLVRCRELKASEPEPACSAPLLQALAENIDAFFMSLATPAPLPQRISRFLPPRDADSFPRPQGPQRVKLLHLMQEALLTDYPPIEEALLQLGMYQVVIDLLLLPHHCNAIHMHARDILVVALGTLEMRPDKQQSLLHEAELPQRLVSYSTYAAAQPFRPSCHAFVMTVASALRKLAATFGPAKLCVAACDGWDDFAAPEGMLADWDALQSNCALGGRLPSRPSDLDDDSDGDGDYDSQRDVERELANAIRAHADSASAAADDDNGPNLCSDELLQYLSGRNFVNEMGHELDDVDDVADESPPADDDGDSPWAAEFGDFDEPVSGTNGAAAGSVDLIGLSAEAGGAPAPACLSAAIFELTDSPSPKEAPLMDNWAAEFEQPAAAADGDGWDAFSAPAPAAEDAFGATDAAPVDLLDVAEPPVVVREDSPMPGAAASPDS